MLGGSGTGSDISIGGDSGISLVDPADSGLSLEAPLNLSSGEESLELGEDDLLGMASDVGAGSGLKGEDDFQLTPMDDLSDGEDSESGSQVIALDTEGEGDEAATMVASSGTPVAAMLDEDLGAEPTLAAMPLAARHRPRPGQSGGRLGHGRLRLVGRRTARGPLFHLEHCQSRVHFHALDPRGHDDVRVAAEHVGV